MAFEDILANGVPEILKKLVIVVAPDFSLAWGVKDELKKLQRTIEMILAVVADAERRQESEEAVRLWLTWLKDVAYDADDVMDEFSYETMRRRERGDRLRHKLLDFASSSTNPLIFAFQMARKIKNINKKFDEVTKVMNSFHLQAAAVDTSMVPGESSERRSRKTASFINDSETVGRKDDMIKIVDLLTKANRSSSSSDVNYPSSENVSTISIVGMGGLGKTTLAQLVYKNELVKKYFDERIWVSVSTDFDVEKILMKIMESITLAKFDNVSNFDLLVNKVQEKLQGKKFLLVLDDLWNENIQLWESLKGPLLVGAKGSKILITTRNMQVAVVVKGSIRPYQLKKLEEDECWSIMEKRAFSPGGALKTPNMINIGKEMANKCSGLPLAAKFLGSLLHSKNKETDWLSIRETEVWNTREGQSEIRPILKLSYDNLSPQLKQCFSYCSIFPKGWVIGRETILHLWMAEGFLGASSNVGNKRSIEDVGEEFFDSLVWSSFFDAVERNDLDDIIAFKMHDLVYDLGRDVVGNHECAIFKISELEKNISDIRRLLLISDDDLDLSTRSRCCQALNELKKLRTLIVFEPNSNMGGHTFSSNKKVRVLHFNHMADGCPGMMTFPVANKLRHLRYLRLINLNLNGTMHDDYSISKLYNLQTLVLGGCASVQNLLRNMVSLKNLRFLDISFSDIKELPTSVTSLCNLQRLNVSHCYNLTTIPNSAIGLKYLKYLDLSFTPIEELPGFIINLCNLQTLDVKFCRKLKSLPEFVASLSNLRIFNFRGCPLLTALPIDFGALTHLRYLNLRDTGITVIPEACSNLHNLERIMETPMGIGNLVCLQTLSYKVPVKVINENECNGGIEELANLNLIEALKVDHLQNVKDPIDAERANLKGKQYLRKLVLNWLDEDSCMMRCYREPCNDVQVLEALQPPTCLVKLVICYFMGRDLPTWMCVLQELEYLELENCRGIKQLPAYIGQFPRLMHLVLKGMSHKGLDISGFPSLLALYLTDMFLLEELCYSYPCLQELGIIGCLSLTEIPSFPSLKKLVLEKIDHKLVCSVGRSQTSLAVLSLSNIDELIYFPISILQNNCNLQTLQIMNCNQFQGFRINDDENVNVVAPYYLGSSLQVLEFIDCPVLKFLPDLRGWTSLRVLVIFNCPRVKESLTYDLKSLSFLKILAVDFIQRDEQRGDPSVVGECVNLMNY